jgi:hypothetical protein
MKSAGRGVTGRRIRVVVMGVTKRLHVKLHSNSSPGSSYAACRIEGR